MHTYIQLILACFLIGAAPAAETPEHSTHDSEISINLFPTEDQEDHQKKSHKKRKKKRHVIEESTQEISEDTLAVPLHELMQPLLRNLRKNHNENPEHINSCCCYKTCGVKCCGEVNICARVFWTITQGATSTLASISNYVRRSIIPLAAFGDFDTDLREKLLTWIAILQAVGETSETIHDYAVSRAIASQKTLRKLDELYLKEKEKAQIKALSKCVECTTPKLCITSNIPITMHEASALRRLYYPQSTQMSNIETEMERLTDLTGCEKVYYNSSKCFWTNTYPFWWFAEVALCLTQLIIVVLDTTHQDDASLTLPILLIASEVIHYFCNSMKHYSQEKTYETYKFRKDIEDIGNGIEPAEENV